MTDPIRPEGSEITPNLSATSGGNVAGADSSTAAAQPLPGSGLPPRRPPKKKRSRALPILLVLFILMVMGAVGVMMLIGTFALGGGTSSNFKMPFSLHDEKIALLKIDETIMPGPMFDFWMKSLQEIGEDDGIDGLVLRLETPGGAVGSSQEIYDEIVKLRKEKNKKVYVSMGNVAASGGYYIASAADRIYANRGTMTGSIGVILMSYQFQDLAEKIGFKVEVIKSGRFKDAGSSFRDMREDERKMFDQLIDGAYQQFISDILAYRETPLAEALAVFPDADWELYQFEKPSIPSARTFLLQIADGRIYGGEQAKHLGLIDDTGSMNKVIEELAKHLGVPARPRRYEPRKGMTIFDLMFSKVKASVPRMMTHPTLQYQMIPF